MDIERKRVLAARFDNLSDGSTTTEWKNFLTEFINFFKEEIAEVLSGAGLQTERGNLDADLAPLIAEMDTDTSRVLK